VKGRKISYDDVNSAISKEVQEIVRWSKMK